MRIALVLALAAAGPPAGAGSPVPWPCDDLAVQPVTVTLDLVVALGGTRRFEVRACPVPGGPNGSWIYLPPVLEPALILFSSDPPSEDFRRRPFTFTGDRAYSSPPAEARVVTLSFALTNSRAPEIAGAIHDALVKAVPGAPFTPAETGDSITAILYREHAGTRTSLAGARAIVTGAGPRIDLSIAVCGDALDHLRESPFDELYLTFSYPFDATFSGNEVVKDLDRAADALRRLVSRAAAVPGVASGAAPDLVIPLSKAGQILDDRELAAGRLLEDPLVVLRRPGDPADPVFPEGLLDAVGPCLRDRIRREALDRIRGGGAGALGFIFDGGLAGVTAFADLGRIPAISEAEIRGLARDPVLRARIEASAGIADILTLDVTAGGASIGFALTGDEAASAGQAIQRMEDALRSLRSFVTEAMGGGLSAVPAIDSARVRGVDGTSLFACAFGANTDLGAPAGFALTSSLGAYAAAHVGWRGEVMPFKMRKANDDEQEKLLTRTGKDLEFYWWEGGPDAFGGEMVYVPGTETIAPFYIGLFEVKFYEFFRVFKNPVISTAYFHFQNNHPGENLDGHPVTMVDYDTALQFCDLFRAGLPTLEEWRLAALGPQDDQVPFPWPRDPSGTDPLGPDDFVCTNNPSNGWLAKGKGWEGPARVGSFPRDFSPWCGAFDMAGNVSEFVLSDSAARAVACGGDARRSCDPIALKNFFEGFPVRGATHDLDTTGFRIVVHPERPPAGAPCDAGLPAARFTAVLSAPLTLDLDGGASIPSTSATIAVFDWDFGDGATAGGAGPDAARATHRYARPGLYRVTLSVRDGFRLSGTETVAIVVSGSGAFRRGDADGSGAVDLADAVFILAFLFQAGTAPACQDSVDADDSGNIDLTDALFLLSYLFQGGGAPPAPGPTACGLDPTPSGSIAAACGYPVCP